MKRTQDSRCFIFLIELDWLNFALNTGADFYWLNTEQLYLDVPLYSNTGIEKFSWGWISIRIRYSMNSKVNICIRRIRIFFRFVTSLVASGSRAQCRKHYVTKSSMKCCGLWPKSVNVLGGSCSWCTIHVCVSAGDACVDGEWSTFLRQCHEKHCCRNGNISSPQPWLS